MRNSCGHATLPRSILPSRSKLARENSGKELKEPNEALCRNEAEGSGISLSRSVENDILGNV